MVKYNQKEKRNTEREEKKMLEIHVCVECEVAEVREVVAESIGDLQDVMKELEAEFPEARVYFDGEEVIVAR